MRRLTAVVCLSCVAALAAACSQGAGSCVGTSTAPTVQRRACRQALNCRASFALNDQEFASQYAGDLESCSALSSVPFIDAVLAQFDEGTTWIDLNRRYYSGMNQCVYAMVISSCESFAQGRLFEQGQACSKAVITGEEPEPEYLTDYADKNC